MNSSTYTDRQKKGKENAASGFNDKKRTQKTLLPFSVDYTIRLDMAAFYNRTCLLLNSIILHNQIRFPIGFTCHLINIASDFCLALRTNKTCSISFLFSGNYHMGIHIDVSYNVPNGRS
jgi:hypothetical protein